MILLWKVITKVNFMFTFINKHYTMNLHGDFSQFQMFLSKT